MSQNEGKFLSAADNFRLFGDCSSDSEVNSEDEGKIVSNVKTEIVNGMRQYNERLKLRRLRLGQSVIRPLWWKDNHDDCRNVVVEKEDEQK